MSVAEGDVAKDKLHALCLERIAFFMHKLKGDGYLPYWSAELEVFFEDKDGNAVHVDRERMQQYLFDHTRHTLYLGNDIKQIDEKERHVKSDAGKLYAWGKEPAKPFSGVTCKLGSYALAKFGIEHYVLPWLARQYEVELLPDPKAKKAVCDAQLMPGFLQELSQMEPLLERAGSQFGYERVSRYTKSYPHTLGYVATPSLHLNVSLWQEKDGKLHNCFAGKEEEKPPPLAKRCMRAMVALQKEGLVLFSEQDNSNYWLRNDRGYHAPRQIAYDDRKVDYHTVCYRSCKDNPDYAHIENRAPSARSDPYLAMALTWGALYMAVCRKQFTQWEKQSTSYSDKIIDYEKGRFVQSTCLREVLGEPLFEAVLQHYHLPSHPSLTRAATTDRGR